MTKHSNVTLITDSAPCSMDKKMAKEIRLLRIVAMPLTLLVNTGKGLWFLLCAMADSLWVDAFGGKE